MKRILVVEDEQSLRKTISMNLEMEGYESVTATTGGEALKIINSQRFDLIILDVMLPEINGFDLCEKIRLTNVETPILFLTAKNSQQDKIEGLKRGGDDYLTKPFNLEEFLLRVKVLTKRSSQKVDSQINIYRFGQNEVNFRSFEAIGIHGTFRLTHKESMLLKLLIDRKNEVVSRKQIMQTVWGYDVIPNTRTIDNFISSYRKYFEPVPSAPQYFLSVRGVGYKFVSETESTHH